MSPVRRLLGLAALPCAALALAACSVGAFSDVKMKVRTEKLPAAAKTAPVTNRYVAVSPKRGASAGSATLRLPFDLWQPFDFSLCVGAYRLLPKGTHETGVFGVRLDERGGSNSYGVFATYAADGLDVTATQQGAGDLTPTTIGEHKFTGAARVELYVTLAGPQLTFRARAAGTPDPPMVIGTVAFDPMAPPEDALPFNPVLVVSGLGDGIEAGFDSFQLGSVGSPPIPTDEAHQAVRDLFVVSATLSRIHTLLDGRETPDVDAALLQIDVALQQIVTARTAVEALPAPAKAKTGRDAALAKLDSVEKAVGQVKSMLTDKGAAKATAAIRKIEVKALRGMWTAVLAVLPQDLKDVLATAP